jgi:hypothetical protein
MRKITLAFAIFGATLLGALYSAPAYAQATRTWISGVGDDANPCSRTAPCKTWAGAISKTAAGGEIDALDPGGFGALTITKAITLDGGGGQVASVLVAGTNGITVAAGSTDVVTIRNIRFQGVNGSGLTGIQFNSGAQLTVENCAIYGFSTAGIGTSTSASASMNITNTYITNTPNGISLTASAGNLYGAIDHVTIQDTSSNGITTSGGGIMVFNVTNTVIAGNNNVGTAVNAGTGGTRLNVDSSSITASNTGFSAASGAIIRISNNTIYNNNANFSIASGGTIATSGNNRVNVNGATVPNSTITQQ